MPIIDNDTSEDLTYQVNDDPPFDDGCKMIKDIGKNEKEKKLTECKGASQTHSVALRKKKLKPFAGGLPNDVRVTVKQIKPHLVVEIEFPPNFP